MNLIYTCCFFYLFFRWDEKITAENAAFLQEVVYETYANKDSPLKDGPWKHGEFTLILKLFVPGVLGLKLGTLPQWDKKGRKFYVTLVQVRLKLKNKKHRLLFKIL